MNDSADSATVSEIQKDVLQRLRLGQELRTSHHEGGTRLFFDGQSFLREDYARLRLDIPAGYGSQEPEVWSQKKTRVLRRVGNGNGILVSAAITD